MRAEVSRLANARLVFGGQERGFSGRFAGVAEEVMLSLADGSAVYICGGFGGAAHAVGQVLGLGSSWSSVPDCLRVETHDPGAVTLESAVKDWGGRFRVPHRDDLPLDYAGLVEILRGHALGRPRWPENGLSPREDRALFRSEDSEEIAGLVVKGLRVRFGNTR
jgi:SLOG cluster2